MMFFTVFIFSMVGLVRRQVAFDGDDNTEAVWVWQWVFLLMLFHTKNS